MKKPDRDKLKGTTVATQKLNFYIATILNPLDDKNCDYFPNGLLVTQTKGKEVKVKDLLPLEKGVKKYGPLMNKKNTIDFGHCLLMPGFFDMHFHWVQDDVREMPKDSLLGWLEKYTFPTEHKFRNKKYTEARARIFFKRLAKEGTIGGGCYSSIHEHAVNAAIKNATGHFVIGNVLMNMNSPASLTQTEEESLTLTKKLIKKHGSKHCFTPRFAITTTPRVMKEGSKMADKAKCFKQTHLSETPQEIEFVLSIYRKLPGFENVKSYTEIYEKTGMLGKRSLMGHGIHLSDKELKTLKKTKTSVIHCPTSNAPLKEKGLGSGLFDFKKVEKAKVRWALGSDIGGGPYLSMFDVMRSFVAQNKKQGRKGASYIKALYRSTLAGADILGVNSGNLDKGKEASFIIVPLPKKSIPSNAEKALKELIEPYQKNRKKYGELVKSVYLNGRRIG
ncbi:MAG: amidohydrolase family protein [Bacteriovoracia bacterium]